MRNKYSEDIQNILMKYPGDIWNILMEYPGDIQDIANDEKSILINPWKKT